MRLSNILRFILYIQYRPNVSYHLSSRFSRDASRFSRDESRFSRDESRFSRESLNRLVWNILLARSRCTLYCIRDFCLRCVVKSVKSKLSTESLFVLRFILLEFATPPDVGVMRKQLSSRRMSPRFISVRQDRLVSFSIEIINQATYF